MLRLGLSSGAFYPQIATEHVPARAAELGVSDIELMLQTRGEYSPAFIRSVRAQVEMAGCTVRAVHVNQPLHPITAPYPRRREEAIALFREGIEATVALGARTIVWHGLSRAESAADETGDAFLTSAELLGGFCWESGITLAIENVSWCVLSSVRDVMAFAARLPELGPPGSIGFVFDPFQAAEAGSNPFMMLAAMDGALVDVHLSDFSEAAAGVRHLPPGDGELPWPALIRAISATGYAGPMMIEGPVPDSATFDRVRRRLLPIIAAVAADGDPCATEPPGGVLEGIRLFNTGKFYEAHEELEHEWHAERRPIRRLYQGILQIGVGFHHARGGNLKGAILLLSDGIAKVSEFQPGCQGIDTARLVRECQPRLAQLQGLEQHELAGFNEIQPPQVHFVNSTAG